MAHHPYKVDNVEKEELGSTSYGNALGMKPFDLYKVHQDKNELVTAMKLVSAQGREHHAYCGQAWQLPEISPLKRAYYSAGEDFSLIFRCP